jgi:hypothetical protein
MEALVARRRGIDEDDEGWEERLFNEGAGFDVDDDEEKIDEEEDEDFDDASEDEDDDIEDEVDELDL